MKDYQVEYPEYVGKRVKFTDDIARYYGTKELRGVIIRAFRDLRPLTTNDIRYHIQVDGIGLFKVNGSKFTIV